MMEKRLKKIVLGAALLLFSGVLYGQRNVLQYADKEYELKRFEHAGSQYSEAYKVKKSYYSARRAAESYTNVRSYQKAFEWWAETVAFVESDREDYLNYARSAVQADKSLSDLGIVLEPEEHQYVYGSLPVPEDPGIGMRAVSAYNGPGTDYGLHRDSYGNIYIVSDRGVEKETSKGFLRFDMRSQKASPDKYSMNDRGYHRIYRFSPEEGFSPVEVDLEGVLHLSMPSFYNDGGKEEILFTAVLRDSDVHGGRSPGLFPGLFHGEMDVDGRIVNVSAFEYNRISDYAVMHGFREGDRIYFSSDMPGGYGGFDLYYCEVLGDRETGPAVNLGPGINGPQNEVSPFVHEGVLYFSSDRPGGLGGLDIYSVGLEEGALAGNMGLPYNSGQDDFAYYIDGFGTPYMSSDRGMADSRDNIYSPVSLKGTYMFRVYEEGGELLDDIEIRVTGTDGRDYLLESPDPAVVKLLRGDYRVELRKEGFFPADVPMSADLGEGEEAVIEYSLVEIPYGKMLAIDTVYYDLDRYEIRDDASLVLDRVAALLERYPEFNLKVTSHTDIRATSEYNEKLSERRSRSVLAYLQGKGIAGERLDISWKGSTEPAIPCEPGIDCVESIHEKNRRSVLIFELYPDKDKDYGLPAGLKYVESTEKLLEHLYVPVGK